MNLGIDFAVGNIADAFCMFMLSVCCGVGHLRNWKPDMFILLLCVFIIFVLCTLGGCTWLPTGKDSSLQA